MEDQLVAELNTQLLMYATGRAIFCPSCDTILDYSRAVLVTGHDAGAGIACVDCWDALVDTYSAVDQAALLAGAEIIDGRNLA